MRQQRADNLILISLDAVRPDSLGCYGSTEIQTPTIDGIANTGICFNQAIAQAPFTPASHASVFTGLNPNRHGIRYMIGQKMRPVPTMAEVFHSAGWATAAFVGASALSREYGIDRGFNVYDEDFKEKNTNWILGFRRDCKESTMRAMDWMKERNKFCLFIHYFDAHAYEGEAVSRETQKRGLEAIDTQIKAILDCKNIALNPENTAIVLFADHADSIDEHAENGHLEYLYDTTLKVPLIMRLPGMKEGLQIKSQVSLVDIFPTLLDYFGISAFLPDGGACDGESLMPLIKDHQNVKSIPAFSETYMAAGQKKSKTTTTRYFSIRTEETKLIYEKLSDTWQSFDLQNNPDETENTYTTQDNLPLSLTDKLMSYIRQGESLEEIRMMGVEEDQVLRSLEALGYVDNSSSRAGGDMAFFAALDEGKKLINLGKLDEAVAEINEALTMRGIKEELQHNARKCLADAYCKLNDSAAAIKQLDIILSSKADPYLSARAAVQLSGIIAEKNDIEEGIQILDKHLDSIQSVSPDIQAMIRGKRASFYREIQKYDEAIADYESILRVSPQNIDACYNLGSLYKHLGNYPKAEARFQQALRISTHLRDKYHGGAHYHLADISLKKSLNTKAENSLRQCLEVNPTHGAAKKILGQVSSTAK